MVSARTRISLKELIAEPFEIEMPDGKIVEVPQPSLRQMLLMTEAASEMQEAETNEDSKAQLDGFKKLISVLETLVPQIKDYDINMPMAMLLMETLQSEAVPEKMEYLESKGVKLDPKEITAQV